VNQFFKDAPRSPAYLAEMNRRAADAGVYQHLIMCDDEGRLGDPDNGARLQAVENHRKWIDAAKTLGCATIRVNAASEGTYEEQQKAGGRWPAPTLRAGRPGGHQRHRREPRRAVVERQLAGGVMRLANHPRCGTLPDFGNFYDYDRYVGVTR